MEGERKVITVLFTDIANYTALAEKLDLEIVREVMNNHFKILIGVVQKYEGTVDQLLGDGMVAFFGAPLAHEDHALRACHAALAMQEGTRVYAEGVQKQYGLEFKMRIGINSGPVLVGSIGNDLHMEYVAIGDTVNLASRLQTTANPGATLVSDDTYSLAKDFFRFAPLGEISVKGREQAVAAYQLTATRSVESRFEAAVAKGLSEFVGREEELSVLKEAFLKAKSSCSQVVGIKGEPGVGKSRLLREFSESLKLENCTYLVGHCLHLGGTTPFRPLIDILKSYFGDEEGNPQPVIKDRMVARLRRLDEDLLSYLPFLHDILSLNVEDQRYQKMGNEYKRSKLFEAITSILMKESATRPVVIAIEDLHWLDKASEEFVTYFISKMTASPILLLLLYRPEYYSPWVNRSSYTLVHLGELSVPAAGELLQSLLPDGEPTSELRQLVLSRAGGNPLFVEEFVRSLSENGTINKSDRYYSSNVMISTIKLPDTLQGIIAERIDRLPEGPKNTLQVASVIGRDFSYSVLQDVTQMPEELRSYLAELERLEFIIRQSVHSETEYFFKHALIQEVAYETLLQKRRRKLHENIGRAIEGLYPRRTEELSEVLAYHFQRGESRNKAAEYLTKSAKKSCNRYAVQESHQFYLEAFKILSAKTEKARADEIGLIDLIIEWALVHYYRADYKGLVSLLNQHQGLVDSLDDKVKRAWFLGWLGHAYFSLGRVAESYQSLQESFRLGQESENQRVMAYAGAWLTWTCCLAGSLNEGLVYGEKAISAWQHIEGEDYPYIKSYAGIGQILASLGQWQRILECAAKLLEFGKSRGNNRSLAFSYYLSALAHFVNGDVVSATEDAKQALEQSVEHEYLTVNGCALAVGYFSQGRLSEAEGELKKVLSLSQFCGFEIMGIVARVYLGLIFMAQGQMEKGFRMLTQSREFHERNGNKNWGAFVDFCLGQVYAQMSNRNGPVKPSLLMKNLRFIVRNAPFATGRATTHFNRAIEIYSQIGERYCLGQAHMELGRLYHRKGKKRLAKENLHKAAEVFEYNGNESSLKEAQTLLESLDKVPHKK